jgi:hypothetical protein
MSKVLLPKEVADSIHYFQVKGSERSLFNIPTISSAATKEKRYKVICDYIQVSDENFKNYFNALVNGYEVEQTKEERLVLIYNNLTIPGQHTLKLTLNTLGIEIKGINKEVK